MARDPAVRRKHRNGKDPAMRPRSARFSFLLKIALTILLVAAFDRLFPYGMEGWAVGLFALAWLIALIVGRRDVRHARLDVAVALAGAAIFGVALAYDPNPLAWVLFWTALSLAALLPRMAGFDDAWRWLLRLGLHGLSGLAKPLFDFIRLAAIRPRGKKPTLRSLAALLGLPLIGTALFTALFASANPVIANLLGRICLPRPGEVAEWIAVTILVWPALRPHRIVTRLRLPESHVPLPVGSVASVLIALTLFNALFAVENGLDIAFLWSGAALPAGMSITEYVHRGAYPLIATALLAGLFALTMWRPGTPTAANPLARRLVLLWVGQNIFLVASSALRTIRYVEEYQLTAWRIAALLWMALVAVGLVLICGRIRFGRSGRWLINANALTASLVLVPCCFVDLGASAAQWNVRHAAEVGGRGQKIDLCYLSRMGVPALLPLVELERGPISADLRERVTAVRSQILDGLIADQSHWWSWTPHGAMRLARAQLALGPSPGRATPVPPGFARGCDGALYPAQSPSPEIDVSALTGAPAQ